MVVSLYTVPRSRLEQEWQLWFDAFLKREAGFTGELGGSDTQLYWLQEDDDTKRIIGFAQVQCLPSVSMLWNVVIAKRERRRGWATQLLKTVAARYAMGEKTKPLELLVICTNTSAQTLYLSLGWMVVGTEQHDRRPCFRMRFTGRVSSNTKE